MTKTLLHTALCVLITALVCLFIRAWAGEREFHDVKVTNEKRIYNRGRIYTVEFEGHEYVIFEDAHKGGITHSPNCWCCTNTIR